MHFALQPRTFNREESKVAFVLTLLSGKAALWGTAVWEKSRQLLLLVPGTLHGDEKSF